MTEPTNTEARRAAEPGDRAVRSLIAEAERTLTRLEADNARLEKERAAIESRVLGPLRDHEAVLRHFNARCLRSPGAELPADLALILAYLLRAAESGPPSPRGGPGASREGLARELFAALVRGV